MDTPEALARLRALRAASYYCQAVEPTGRRCARRAHDVHPLTEAGQALCPFHYAERGQPVRTRPAL